MDGEAWIEPTPSEQLQAAILRALAVAGMPAYVHRQRDAVVVLGLDAPERYWPLGACFDLDDELAMGRGAWA